MKKRKKERKKERKKKERKKDRGSRIEEGWVKRIEGPRALGYRLEVNGGWRSSREDSDGWW